MTVDDTKLGADEIIHLTETDLSEAHRQFPSVDDIVNLFPSSDMNHGRLRVAARKMGFTALGYDMALKALRARERETEKANAWAAKEAKKQGVVAYFGHFPANERDYIGMGLDKHLYEMGYDGRWFKNGVPISMQEVLLDLQLTACDFGLVKPRGNDLSGTAITQAFEERRHQLKAERLQTVIDRINAPITEEQKKIIDKSFEQFCYRLCTEPDFGEAGFRQCIIQHKKRMDKMPVAQAFFFVLVGPQNAGKTYTVRHMLKPIEELTAECSLQDALDDRQMELPTMFTLFIDEMARLDRTSGASLKTFITGEGASRRPMRTNATEKVLYNASLIATSNQALELLIYDNTGMRRYVEIFIKSRAEIEPYWEQIENFDWLTLWRSISVHDEEPLIAKYGALLRQKQESIRNQSNPELWITSFQYDPRQVATKWSKEYGNENRYGTNEEPSHRPETSSHEKIEFFAEPLYRLFREWEEIYDPGFKTSLNAWGKQMKTMIDTKQLPDWEWHMAGTKKVYGWHLKSNQPETGLVVVDSPDWRQKRRSKDPV